MNIFESRGDKVKLIVGLGNPGKEFSETRHNIGFMFLDYYLNNKDASCHWKKKFNGLYMEVSIHSEKVIFLKPQSYMNLSGSVVRQFANFYKIDVSDILVISDDLDLKIGNFKLKDKGSSGGHNGLKDIESNLGTPIYKRLRIGISNDKNLETKDYVLGRISADDKKVYDLLFQELSNILDQFFELDFMMLMNQYNQKNR